jgi:hypothetical protein
VFAGSLDRKYNNLPKQYMQENDVKVYMQLHMSIRFHQVLAVV